MSSFTSTVSLPTDSTVKISSWLFILIIALVIHVAAFITYELKNVDQKGAKHEGVQGIEIGFKEITLPKKQQPPLSATEKPKEKVVKKNQEHKQIINKKDKLKKTPAVKKHSNIAKKLQPVSPPKITHQEVINTASKEINKVTNTALTTQSNKVIKEDSTEIENTSRNSKRSLGGGDPKAKISYRQLLLQQLERYKRYPKSAMRRNQEGIINLEFIIDKDGNILSYKLLTPSKYKSLNKAVEKMIKKANPLPQIPDSVNNGASEYRFIAPIKFELSK